MPPKVSPRPSKSPPAAAAASKPAPSKPAPSKPAPSKPAASKPSVEIQYWYDPHHKGSLRAIDMQRNVLYGVDPNGAWSVPFERVDRSHIKVDFSAKKGHRGAKEVIASYGEKRDELHWPDENTWLRVRVDPTPLLGEMMRVAVEA